MLNQLNTHYHLLTFEHELKGERQLRRRISQILEKCDEKDLSAAYMEAQMKKLPLLFLYTQDLNKKAAEMLDAGAFENVIVTKIN